MTLGDLTINDRQESANGNGAVRRSVAHDGRQEGRYLQSRGLNIEYHWD